MKKLFKIMLVVGFGAALVGAYMAWRSGCCKDWSSSGSWSQWSCGDDQEPAEV